MTAKKPTAHINVSTITINSNMMKDKKIKLQLYCFFTTSAKQLVCCYCPASVIILLRWNMACFHTIIPTGNSTAERLWCHAVHRQISHYTQRVHSICRRCQKIHHDGWWVWVITSKCLLPWAVMHGGLVGSQSVLAAVCINCSLWQGIPWLMRHDVLLYFLLLLRLIIW